MITYRNMLPNQNRGLQYTLPGTRPTTQPMVRGSEQRYTMPVPVASMTREQGQTGMMSDFMQPQSQMGYQGGNENPINVLRMMMFRRQQQQQPQQDGKRKLVSMGGGTRINPIRSMAYGNGFLGVR